MVPIGRGRGSGAAAFSANDAADDTPGAGGTRMIIEGEDALEQVVRLLRAAPPGGEAGKSQELRAVASGLRRRNPDLPRKLRHELGRLAGADPGASVARLMMLEHANPDLFLAGAVAGLALAGTVAPPEGGERGTGTPDKHDNDRPPRRPRQGEAGVVEHSDDAQTGSGGLGSLDRPPDREK